MGKRRWGWALFVVGCMLAAAAGVKSFGRETREPGTRPVRVSRGDVEVTILATGVVQPQNRLEIKPPIAGRVEGVLVQEGQNVKKGQILAWMSSTERAALLDAARAKGPQELAHWEELYKPAPLVSPLEGVVIARNVEPGQTVTASDPVLVLSDRLIAKGQVDETDIGQIAVGQPARIVLDAYPKESIPARVDHIAYEAKTVNNVTIYEVDVLPEKVPDFMRSGMTANVTFQAAAHRGVLILPMEAVRQRGDQMTVLMQKKPGEKPVSQEIETGLSDGKRVEVLSGLSEGDSVLVTFLRMPKQGGGGSNPFSPFGGRPQGGGGHRSS